MLKRLDREDLDRLWGVWSEVFKHTDPTEDKVKMDDPNITMEEYIRLEEEKAHRRVLNDALTSEVTLCEPTVSPPNDNKINFRISFDESDDEDYTETPIRRIQDIEGEYSGRYQTWSLLQEIPNTPYPTSPDTAYRLVSRPYK
ncbi:hypothetical protein Tco_0855058 [Tanacetum coccineum]